MLYCQYRIEHIDNIDYIDKSASTAYIEDMRHEELEMVCIFIRGIPRRVAWNHHEEGAGRNDAEGFGGIADRCSGASGGIVRLAL